MTIAVLRTFLLRSAPARKPAWLVSALAAMARALDCLQQPDLASEPANPSRRPRRPTIVVDDVLDVIGGDRGVDWHCTTGRRKMFPKFAPPDEGIGLPWQGSQREPSFWRGLVLVALIAVAGLALSVLAGLPTPNEQLTVLEETR